MDIVGIIEKMPASAGGMRQKVLGNRLKWDFSLGCAIIIFSTQRKKETEHRIKYLAS